MYPSSFLILFQVCIFSLSVYNPENACEHIPANDDATPRIPHTNSYQSYLDDLTEIATDLHTEVDMRQGARGECGRVEVWVHDARQRARSNKELQYKELRIPQNRDRMGRGATRSSVDNLHTLIGAPPSSLRKRSRRQLFSVCSRSVRVELHRFRHFGKKKEEKE